MTKKNDLENWEEINHKRFFHKILKNKNLKMQYENSLLVRIKKCEKLGISYESILNTQKEILAELVKTAEEEFTTTSIVAVENKREFISELEFAYKEYKDFKEGIHHGHRFVDLGLPSGTLWADCNVGAEKPEEFGDYFAWGETKFKEKYHSNNYIWRADKIFSDYKLLKYCTIKEYGSNGEIDNKTVLELNDDAANANWGGNWRMPTAEEQDELEYGCTHEWLSINGVNGYKFTSIYNGNSIFLPASGLFGLNLKDSGVIGVYNSNSLDSDNPDKNHTILLTPEYEKSYFSINRMFGGSVRPVLKYGQMESYEDDNYKIDENNDNFYEENTENCIDIKDTDNKKNQTDDKSEYKLPKMFSLLMLIKKCEELDITYESILTTQKETLAKLIKIVEENFTIESIQAIEDKQNFISELESIPEITVAYEIYKSGIHNGHRFVDLGLPSGTLWADCNVGTEKPEEFGDYFAWGETQPKDEYTYRNYKWHEFYPDPEDPEGKYLKSRLTKYCVSSIFGNPDYKTILDLEDDAANANWGGKWRMPTWDEQEELIEGCINTFTTLNGVEGYKLTSKKNGNSIFLPMAIPNTTIKSDYLKDLGVYPSCRISRGDDDWVVGINFREKFIYTNMLESERYWGYPVRPVLTLI